jgi:hypothetical protein
VKGRRGKALAKPRSSDNDSGSAGSESDTEGDTVEGGAEFPEAGGESGSDDESTYATHGTNHAINFHTNDASNTNNDTTETSNDATNAPEGNKDDQQAWIDELKELVSRRPGAKKWRSSGPCSASLGIGTRREHYYTN